MSIRGVEPRRNGKPQVEGEGSYTASRDYATSVDDFLERKGKDVERLAKGAAKSIDEDKSGELKKAEEIGKSHAKK